jgi:hypothetical protein
MLWLGKTVVVLVALAIWVVPGTIVLVFGADWVPLYGYVGTLLYFVCAFVAAAFVMFFFEDLPEWWARRRRRG